MSKYDISIHPLIQQYLHDLSQELACIPNNDREQHVLEIEGHLQSLVEEKIVQGKNTEQAIDEALKEFLPAKKLAKQIIDEAGINNIKSSVSCCPSNRTEKKWPLDRPGKASRLNTEQPGESDCGLAGNWSGKPPNPKAAPACTPMRSQTQA